MGNTLEDALARIEKLENENKKLRAELEVYKKRNTGGRKKHDAAWNASYKDFIIKYEKGMSIMEIVAEGNISSACPPRAPCGGSDAPSLPARHADSALR